MLGEGPCARVFLGIAPELPMAAIKLYRPGTDPSRVDAELSALGRVAHAHSVRVLDVASGADGDCLILERLELGSLAHLLARRHALTAGEALTILAPLGAAIDAAHSSGVAHRALSPSSVLFRESGAPVLARFGSATLHEPLLTPARLADLPAVVDDRRALGRLARLVLERVDYPDARLRAVLDWLDSLEEAGHPDAFGEALADRLFEFIEPTAVRFATDDDPPLSRVPARAVTAESFVAPVDPAATSGWLRGVDLPPWLAEFVGESLDGSPVQKLMQRVVASARTVRRPLWIVAGAVAAALVIAVVAIPVEPKVTAGAPIVSPSETPLATGPVSGDDPIAALDALLAARERCIRELSVLCLDNVDQPSSAAMADDVALIQGLQNGGEVQDAAISTVGAELVERLGDSALLRLAGSSEAGAQTPTASVLLMKGEAGWRIRGYLT
jgi:hypothetical protein